MTISDSVREVMVALAKAHAPNEVWGLVIDHDTVCTLRNVAEDPTQGFLSDPVEVAQVLERHGWTYIGVWHSHPGGKVEPSNVDLTMHPDGKVMYIIAGEEVHEYGVAELNNRA